MQRYGSIKDLLPLLLSTVDSKAGTLHTEQALIEQSKDLVKSFSKIRTGFYYLVENLLVNQTQSNEILRKMLQQLNYDVLRMGLEDEQEAYVFDRIDAAIEDAIQGIDPSVARRDTFFVLLPNLKEILGKQQELADGFSAIPTQEQTSLQELNSSYIELF